MIGIAMMLTISGDDTIWNEHDSGSTDLVNIHKEKEGNAIFSSFFIYALKRYAFVTWH